MMMVDALAELRRRTLNDEDVVATGPYDDIVYDPYGRSFRSLYGTRALGISGQRLCMGGWEIASGRGRA